MLLPALASGGLSRKNAQSRANRSLVGYGRRIMSHACSLTAAKYAVHWVFAAWELLWSAQSSPDT